MIRVVLKKWMNFRQKLFVYKSLEKDVVILLQIMKSDTEKDSWNNSLIPVT